MRRVHEGFLSSDKERVCGGWRGAGHGGRYFPRTPLSWIVVPEMTLWVPSETILSPTFNPSRTT